MADLTVWSARFAMLLYAAALGYLLIGRHKPSWRWRARFLYTVGATVFIAHIAAAFHFHHHWSHAEAMENVRRQTLEFTGVASGVGLWLNYLFAAVWVIDALWWWIAGGERYLARRRWITLAVHGFMLFMGVNATIVFPTGPTRIVGSAVGVALLVIAFITLSRPVQAAGESMPRFKEV